MGTVTSRCLPSGDLFLQVAKTQKQRLGTEANVSSASVLLLALEAVTQVHSL